MRASRNWKILIGIVSAMCVRSFSAQERPNFLFLYTDDQRWDALSVVQKEQGERARFPWFQTPNMDRIADEADLNSKVVGAVKPGFTGIIYYVGLYSGEMK